MTTQRLNRRESRLDLRLRRGACAGALLGILLAAGAPCPVAIAQPPAGEPPAIDEAMLKAMLEEMARQSASEPDEADAPDAPEPKDAKPPVANAKAEADIKSEESLARFQQLLQRRPFHGAAFAGLVNHYAERGKLKDLVAEYDAKAKALPDDVALRIVLARLQLRAGDATAAAAILDKIDKLPPDLARQTNELLVLKSEVYQKTGDNAGAERVLKEAQKSAGSVSEQLRLGEALADLYLRTDRSADAIASLQALADQHLDNYLHQKHIAGALAQRGLYDAAVERLKKMQPLVKDEVERRCEVLRELGLAYEKLAKRDEAIAVYIEAVGLLASDHWLVRELHEKIVTLYRAANRLEDLATYCRTQIERAPEQTAMRVLLADVQAALGKPEDGKKTFEQAVELFPKDLALSQKRVEFLERLGDVEGVSSEYQRAIGQHGDDSELYIAYGQFLAGNRQVEGARNQWQHVLGTKLTDASLAVRLGALFEAYDLYDDAAQAYERAIAVAPKQTDGYAALARMWRSQGNVENAAAVLKRMGDANPQDGSVQGARAQALRDLGKTEEALEAITRACELLPDQVRFQQVRSELLVQNGRLDEALEVRRAIIDKIANPVQRAEAIGTLVSMYDSADKLPALKASEEARLKDQATNVVSLLILARVADAEKDFPAVNARLDAVLKADPGNETALAHKAKLQDATGDVDGAIATYAVLIDRYPARARQFYESIVDLKLRYGDRAGAVTTLEQMAKNDPTSAATLSAVAEQMVRMGDPERALPFFEKALAVQADRHETRLDYGKALFDAGRVDDAAAVFRIVATQRSDTDRASEALGRLHDAASQLGRLEELIDELQQQVEADPRNTLVARALAQLLVRELEYTRAMELLDLVLRHNPRDVDLSLGRAEVLRRQAKYPEAVEAYQNVLRFPQIDRDYVLGELGKTYFESGQVDQARRLWKQVQNKLYAGSLLKNNGLVDESIAAFEEGIRIKPDEYALHRNLIGAFEASGRTDDALAAARRLLDIEPGNIWNIERLAEAHLRANDRAGAAAVAARLFSADVSRDKLGLKGGGGMGGTQYQSFAGAMSQSAAAQYGGAYSGYYGGQGRSNLERGVQFFLRNGLRAELEAALDQQMTLQPENAVLKDAAATLYMSQLNKPERALTLLRELETANFPIEQQDWLGQCSQRDFMRIKQYNLIASKPALRDAELSRLEAMKVETLGRDDLLLFAMIRSAQGSTDKARDLLLSAVRADNRDTLALGALMDMLVAAEKFADAEPHARQLVTVLAENRAKMHTETLERVRRDFVRSLPVEFQLRITEQVLSDIAEKWTLGQGWTWWQAGTAQSVGYLRARLTLATICAETDRMDEARAIWKDLAPKHGPDVDRWTMLGDTAQLHKQEDLAFEFYQNALKSAKTLAGDALLRQVYSSSTSQRSWYGEDATIDKAFNSIVDAFSKRDSLVELYDFLRDTDQEGRARRLAEQYKLAEKLKPIYEKRVVEAATAFKASRDGALNASPAYFAQVCKLAELSDRAGDWAGAQAVYEAYLKDFPDELGLLTLMGEVAEARLKTEEAIDWEKKVLDCKTRLSRQAREWSLRDLALTPAVPQSLSGKVDAWSWGGRWGQTNYGYGGMSGSGDLERWPSWMRLAQLHLATNNSLAAADAMQHAVAEAGPRRDMVVREALDLIQQRQQTAQMLGVLRTLAVYAPTDERVQLAFAESLEGSGRKDLALEVCNRMLRRGVSDLGLLTELRRRVDSLSPSQAAQTATLASLAEESAADPTNLKTRLRLAKAYYYALDLDHAQELLAALAQEAPHLEDVHELLIEVYTLRGDSDKLIAALKAQVDRLTDDRKRRTARWRLVDELLASGKADEAMTTAKELGDPRDPYSYTRIGALLHYFGRTDEAIALLEQAGKSKQTNQYGGRGGGDFGVAQSLAMKGDYAGAADKIMTAMDEQSRQQIQYGGSYAFSGGDQGGGFAALEPMFALYPDLAVEVTKRVEARRTSNPSDVPAIKLMMALHRSLGRPDKAEALLEQMAADGAADQALVGQRIDIAVRRREYPKAIDLAQKFIAQAPKPQIPPGMPAQYAGYAALQSPRVYMLCKLGDVYWDMGEKDKAFETYAQIVDKKVDETRTAYAAICLMRGRTDEARTLVDEALAGQKVKSPNLLQFRAFISVLDGQIDRAFDALCEAAAPGGDPQEDMYGRGGSPIATLSSLAQRSNMMDKFEAFVRDRTKKSPDEWENYALLSNALWTNGRPDDALKVLDQAAESAPLRQQALQTRLQWRRALAPTDELIPLYEKLIELAEREVQPSAGRGGQYGMGGFGGYGGRGSSGGGQGYREELADLLWDAGEKERAEKLWSERTNMQRAETHLRLGELYMERFEYDKAQAAFKRAAELEPDDSSAHRALAEEAYCRADRKGMLPHMLKIYRNGEGAEDQSAYARYGYDQSGMREPGQMCEWALAIKNDAQAMAFIDSPEAGDKAPEYRVMLASLTGDWPQMETLLRERIEAGTPDPMLWRLWGKVQQRKCDWAQAAKAMEFLRRTRLTTINDHENKLELVLAGKQLKEAAAGTRQAQQGAMAAQSGTTYSRGYYGGSYYGGYGGYGGWWDSDSGSSTILPSIYIKLGDFQRAERLYLISSGEGGVEGKLPWLASLMWEQKAKDRALELMRLSLSLPTRDSYSSRGGRMLVQYASMLSEAGKADEACELLIRAYRWSSSGADSARMYGYAYAAQQGFEQGEESSVSGALHQILKRTGKLDATITRLAAESAKDPSDPQLGKLVMSLLKHERRWAELRDMLAARAAASPGETGLTIERIGAACQLGQWDDALKLIEQARKETPGQPTHWNGHEAFVHLMRKEPEKAVAAIKPLLDDPTGADMSSIWATVLAATKSYDQLTAHLQKERADGVIDDGGRDLLFRLLVLQKQPGDAYALAMEQVWQEPGVLRSGNRWWRAARGVAAANPTLNVPADRPADKAMLILATQGAAPGIAALKPLADAPDSSVDALRGLLLAATLAGDDALAMSTNQRLLDTLAPRRMAVWYRPPRPSLQQMAKRTIAASGQYGGTSQVAMGGGMTHQVSQIISDGGGGSGGPAVMTYDDLWKSHQVLQRALLARAGERDKLAALLRTQERALQSGSYGGDDYEQQMYYSTFGGMGGITQRVTYGRNPYSGYGNDDQMHGDWRSILRQQLARAGKYEALKAEFDQLAARTPQSERVLAAETAAALGQVAEAVQARRRLADTLLANLQATDTPDISSGSSDPWRWYWYGYGYGAGSEDVRRLRSALNVGSADMFVDGKPAPLFHGQPTELWQIALVDPEVEQRLLACESLIAPGWNSTRTLSELVQYRQARKEADKVVALIEKSADVEQIMRGELLASYLWACFRLRDTARIEAVLTQAERAGETLKNDLDLTRLVLLRMTNKAREADEFESRLIERCVDEKANPHQIDTALISAPAQMFDLEDSDLMMWQALAQQQAMLAYRQRLGYQQMWRYSGGGRALTTSVPDIPDLAMALGVNFERAVGENDLTASAVRMAYQRHGLYADAVRILDRELASATLPSERQALLKTKAAMQVRAGQKDAAAQTARELETLIKADIAGNPSDARPQMRLARLYSSEEWGRDDAKALECLILARKIDPACDRGGQLAVNCLSRLGRHQQAWEAWKSAEREDEQTAYDEPTIYQASLSALRAGQEDAGRTLARVALYRYPASTMAPETRELIHDKLDKP